MGPPVGRAATGAVTVVVAQEGQVTAAPPGVRQWVYLGEDAAWPLEAARGALDALERLPTGSALAATAERLRTPYLDWIAELGVANDSFEWWSSQLAAKNVYTFLFQRLCALAVAIDLLRDDLLVICSSAALVDAVADAARAAGLQTTARRGGADRDRAVRDAGFGVLNALPRRRAAQPGQASASVDTLLVTWVDGRSFDADGTYRDPHLGPLGDLLRDRGQDIALLARILPSAPYRETAARLAASTERVYLPEAFLTAADRRRCWKRARSFDPVIPQDAHVAGVPAARLARELVTHQRISHAEALSYGPLFAHLAASGLRPARLVFPWEGHAWETAMTAAARRHLPGTEVIAYDNLNFSRFALSLYPGAAELDVRPLPDRVVTNGPTFARVLGEQGFPPERIRAGCALRHAHLSAGEGAEPAAVGDERFVLAAGSIDAAQTIEMVQTAHAAFGDDLLVKLHPVSDIARIRTAVSTPVTFTDRPIDELLARARAMIYTYSVVPYEALAAGVPPIHFVSQTLLDLDQLDPTPDVRWIAASPQELREALAAAELSASDPGWPARSRAVVRDALTPPSDACISAFLEPLAT